MSHFLVCVDTHHHQARFVLFDRCRTLSLCVCTNDSQCLSSFTNWTSRSSAASYKAEYSVSVISPVVLPEKRCLKMESAVMDADIPKVGIFTVSSVTKFKYWYKLGIYTVS
jgi:hypothetical protein